ncbi:hypothetical protein CWE16_02130 [Synechococcus sp. BS55D]|nr:hypothetical protein CWE16_02130 [Synechococcus sp. BS55D]
MRVRHWFIVSRWQRWLFPVVCCVPYVAILVWLLGRGLFWVAQVLLAPLLMGAVLAALTLWLARQEFRAQLPGRKIKRSLD